MQVLTHCTNVRTKLLLAVLKVLYYCKTLITDRSTSQYNVPMLISS